MDPKPTARRALAAVVALTSLVAMLGVGPASAEPPSRSVVPPASPALPVPATPPAPAPSGPVWLPLRRNVDGGEIKLGCTYDSHGSQFGYECGGHHDRWALDLMADAGTPVYASGAGFATNGSGAAGGSGYGLNVRIDHGGGLQTIYGHLSEVLVPAEGAWVDEDTVIGLVGSTGSSSANHLHYELRRTMPDGSAVAVDPGPLKACALGVEVSYPQVRGHDSWQGLPWGSFTLFSDGTDCGTVPPPPLAPADGSPSDGPGRFWLTALARLGRRTLGPG